MSKFIESLKKGKTFPLMKVKLYLMSLWKVNMMKTRLLKF